jgi:uncharacterized membrane-anchored protein
LPRGLAYFPPKESKRLLYAISNTVDDSVSGLIVPTADEKADWFAVMSCINAGHIKHDDAKDWNADGLLNGIQGASQRDAQVPRHS